MEIFAFGSLLHSWKWPDHTGIAQRVDIFTVRVLYCDHPFSKLVIEAPCLSVFGSWKNCGYLSKVHQLRGQRSTLMYLVCDFVVCRAMRRHCPLKTKRRLGDFFVQRRAPHPSGREPPSKIWRLELKTFSKMNPCSSFNSLDKTGQITLFWNRSGLILSVVFE